jgi:hypothetical protein
LQAGPATVPDLAGKTGLPADQVLWQLAGMRKYGQVQEAGMSGDYVKYELVTLSK